MENHLTTEVQESSAINVVDEDLMKRGGEAVAHILAEHIGSQSNLSPELMARVYQRVSHLHRSLGNLACASYTEGIITTLLDLGYDSAARQIERVRLRLSNGGLPSRYQL